MPKKMFDDEVSIFPAKCKEIMRQNKEKNLTKCIRNGRTTLRLSHYPALQMK